MLFASNCPVSARACYDGERVKRENCAFWFFWVREESGFGGFLS
jgi:hypothetical protein